MRAGSQFRDGSGRAAVIALGLAMLSRPLAWADAGASRICRGTIAKRMSGLADTGFKTADTCHKAADKASTSSGPCNDVSNPAFDPKGKYAAAHAKATVDIGKKCVSGDPVLANYSNPPASGPDAVVGGVIDEDVGGNSTLVQGSDDLNGEGAKAKCLETVGKQRTAIIKEILKNSIKCQVGKDKTATAFGDIDPSCVDTGAKSTATASTKIPAACGTLAGSDVGSCTPLPQCVIDAATGVGQEIAKAIYKKVPPPSVCGNGVQEGDEQCDHGANNGTSGDTCSAQCESLAETCGPGTPAGGTITGHRVITVNLTVPPSSPLAGVRIGFDYPQLEASIQGMGTSSVVQGAFEVQAPAPPDGYLATGFDSDFEAGFVISSVDDFIATGPLVKVTLEQCTALSQNICNRSQNITGCCTTADIAACEADPSDYNACKCGPPVSGVTAENCAAAPFGPCTTGACASPPTNANTSCSKKCTAGAYSKLNPSPAACTSNANCDAPPHCDDPGTLTCTDGDPNKFGATCTAATQDADCGPTPTPTCSSGTFCLKGDPGRIGLACSIKDDCGTPVTVATCQACPQLGDRSNATFGCLDVTDPPVCKIGHFPAQAVGMCDGTASGPADGCPSNNVCETQTEITTKSCTVTNPVDHLGRTIGGVTCNITITEAP